MQPGGLNTESIKEKALEWWNGTSAYCRFHLAIFACASAVAFVFWCLGINLLYFLFASPYLVAHNIQIWRLLTSFYITDSLLGTLVTIWMFRQHCNVRETYLGTARFACYFVINGVIIQLVIVVFYWLLGSLLRMTTIASWFGFWCPIWGIIMMEMTIDVMQRPEDQVRLMFIPIDFKYWYMIPLFCILGLFAEAGIPLNFVLGVVAGYGHHIKKLEFTKISDNFAQKLDNSVFGTKMRQIGGYANCSECVLAAGENSDAPEQQAGPGAQPTAQPDRFPGSGNPVG